MEQKDFILKDEVCFCDESFFHDKKEHTYEVTCYDGYGIGYLIDADDYETPTYIKVIYPTLQEVLADDGMASEVLEYCGLYDLEPSDINYGDIMLTYGEIQYEL